MALTQSQWYDKLKAWAPGWYFENEVLNKGVLNGLAAVLAAAQSDVELLQGQTFFTQATAPYLDALGSERSSDRTTGESDANYSARIRSLVNACNLPALQSTAQGLVATGTAVIWGPTDGIFVSRDIFVSRRAILNDNYFNAFMIIVDTQPVGSTGDNALTAIASAIQSAKAAGVLFKMVEMHT